MTNYTFLCTHSGSWAFDGKSGTSYYIIAVKEGNCKPITVKASKTAYDACKELKAYDTLNLLFDERQVCVGVNKV